MNKQKVYAWHLLGDGKLAHPHGNSREVELGETLYVTGKLVYCLWAMHGMRHSIMWHVPCRNFLRVCRVELTDATFHGWKYMARSRKIVAYKDFPNVPHGLRAYRTANVRVKDINAKNGWVILEGWKVR
jgi:hypothetical protein